MDKKLFSLISIREKKSETRERARLKKPFVSHIQLTEDSSRLSNSLRGKTKTVFPQHDVTVHVARFNFSQKKSF